MADASDSPTNDEYQQQGSTSLTTKEAILHQKRIDAYKSCDTPVYDYHRYSFFRDFLQCRGRNIGMLAMPLLALLIWGIFWQLIFMYADDDDYLKESIGKWGDLIDPLWVPIAFLMVFRLTRAAIRFWDSRAAMGKLIQNCRDTVSTAAVALNAPQRLAARGGVGEGNNLGSESLQNNLHNKHNELLDKYARWVCAYPIAVKNFLRPRMDKQRRKPTDDDARFNELRYLLSVDEAHLLLDANNSVLIVLDHLRELAYDMCFVVDIQLHPAAAAELYKQLNTHLDSLSGAFGAMERICGTPLPFVYVAHLRTFLLIYLLLFNMYSIAVDGWAALIICGAINWAMLGLESASVECERPFGRSPNHLPLAKFCHVIGENIVQTLEETKRSSVAESWHDNRA